VVENKADFGIAFDGDGDRLAMADRDGRLFDGDQLLYAMVKHRALEKRLRGGVVGTLMTNFALEKRFAEMGIAFARAKVGDRYVLELLVDAAGNAAARTPATSSRSTAIRPATRSSLPCRCSPRSRRRARPRGVHARARPPAAGAGEREARRQADLQAPAVREAIASAEADLAGRGRVLLRPSGTEPVVRVMVEGEDRAHVQALAESIAAAVRTSAGVVSRRRPGPN
jgi:phosphoglucosamine mutase